MSIFFQYFPGNFCLAICTDGKNINRNEDVNLVISFSSRVILVRFFRIIINSLPATLALSNYSIPHFLRLFLMRQKKKTSTDVRYCIKIACSVNSKNDVFILNNKNNNLKYGVITGFIKK